MTSVNMPRDDAAIHTSKTTNNRTVKEAQPYPETRAVQEHENVINAPRKKPAARLHRRKGERRKKNTAVLLDTRDGHDRRNIGNQAAAETAEDGNEQNSTGINIYT